MKTVKNITESEIRALRSEANEAGDYDMGAVCDLALNGQIDTDDYTVLTGGFIRELQSMTQDEALRRVVDAINDAQAQEV